MQENKQKRKKAIFEIKDNRVFIEAEQDQILSIIQDKERKRELVPGFIENATGYIIFNSDQKGVV